MGYCITMVVPKFFMRRWSTSKYDRTCQQWDIVANTAWHTHLVGQFQLVCSSVVCQDAMDEKRVLLVVGVDQKDERFKDVLSTKASALHIH